LTASNGIATGPLPCLTCAGRHKPVDRQQWHCYRATAVP